MTKRTLSENLDLTLDYNAYHLVAPTVTINGNNVNQDTSTTSSPSFRGLAVFGDITSTGDVHAHNIFAGGTGNVGTILTANGVVTNSGGLTINGGTIAANSTSLVFRNPTTNLSTIDFIEDQSTHLWQGRLQYDSSAATWTMFVDQQPSFTLDNYSNPTFNLAQTLRIVFPNTITPSTSYGLPGSFCWDTGYLYICTANNTWKRVALSTY